MDGKGQGFLHPQEQGDLERETNTGLDAQDIFLRHAMAWLPMSFTLPKSSAHWKAVVNSVTFPGTE